MLYADSARGYMFIEVFDGSKSRWLSDRFFTEAPLGQEDEAFALPHWFEPPQGSIVRRVDDYRSAGFSRMEVWSFQGSALSVLEHYQVRAQSAGIKTMPSLKREVQPGVVVNYPRFGPGFYGESEEFRFGIDAFEHESYTFWTIQLHTKRFVRPTQSPSKLKLVGFVSDRVHLLDEDTGKEYLAPASALLDHQPGTQQQPDIRQEILWGDLPAWVQFGEDERGKGELRGCSGGDREGEWWATRDVRFKGNPREKFAFFLKWLDERGFDRTGQNKSDRSYFVSILQGGASLNLKVQSDSGDRAMLTVLNTLGFLTVRINYIPIKRAPKPPICV